IEYIHENVHAKTLFSTHYHELTDLEKELSGLQNIHVSAVEENGKVVFLHKIKEGPADKSYGIHVAELAELPKSLIERASRILEQLENDDKKIIIASVKQPEEVHEEVQLSMFPVEPEKKVSSKETKLLKEIASMNIMQMTPMDAMNKLYELQSKIH
ncbi:DNA mismatch repair protein MutS, partial [Listeria monocytogenes]|nr:DNA mismatch repair protein MutS [Listeria monocytogenes]